jgi:hypothetical protein
MLRAAIWTFALALSSFGADALPVGADKLLTPGAAGPFRIGMKVDTVKTITHQERIKVVDLNGEGLFSPAIVIYPGVVAEIRTNDRSEWVIDRLIISDPTYYTPKGVHVGSKLPEIRMKYPSAKISHEEGEHVLDEESGTLFNFSDLSSAAAIVESITLFNKR